MPLGKSFEEYRETVIREDPLAAEEIREANVELELGIALTMLRQQRGLSQRALAERCGIKQPMLARIERGSQSPGMPVITKILHALDGVLMVNPDGRVSASPLEAGAQAEGKLSAVPATEALPTQPPATPAAEEIDILAMLEPLLATSQAQGLAAELTGAGENAVTAASSLSTSFAGRRSSRGRHTSWNTGTRTWGTTPGADVSDVDRFALEAA